MNVDRFVGLPWRDRGRTGAGVDCWGLVRLVYAEELSIELPDRADDYAHAGDRRSVAHLVSDLRKGWVPVAGAHRPCDVVLVRQAPWHVGIVVGRGLMLHIPEGKTSCIEPYSTGRFGDRVEGVYRRIEGVGQLA